jgi:hypothetical protein
MINYYFFQFIKKKIGPDRTGPWTVPWGSGPWGLTVRRVQVFQIWTALDQTVRDRGPSGFEPDRTVFNTLVPTISKDITNYIIFLYHFHFLTPLFLCCHNHCLFSRFPKMDSFLHLYFSNNSLSIILIILCTTKIKIVNIYISSLHHCKI